MFFRLRVIVKSTIRNNLDFYVTLCCLFLLTLLDINFGPPLKTVMVQLEIKKEAAIM